MAYAVAKIIRGEIIQYKGINLQPLNVDDLSLLNSRAILLRSHNITGVEYKGGKNELDKIDEPCLNLADKWKIIMTGQDLVIAH